MMTERIIRIATRKSALALWQANTVKELLEKQGHRVELNLVVTSGDKMQRGALADVAIDDPNLPAHLKTGKGLFVKEVQEEILGGRADLAVHSMKDLPVETTPGLRVACVLQRADPSDVMIFSPNLIKNLSAHLGSRPLECSTDEIIQGMRLVDWKNMPPVGTTSARRQGFLRKTFQGSDIDLKVLRGNVDTRLARVAANEFSFIMLARAGIDRLNLHHPETMLTLSTQLSIPAPAQGIVAIECREADSELNEHLRALNHPSSSLSAALERTVLWLTGGNCHTALAVFRDSSSISSWAEAHGMHQSLQFQLEPEELNQWEKKASLSTHGQLFMELRKSGTAERMHAQLLKSGYDKLMPLRTPHSLD